LTSAKLRFMSFLSFMSGLNGRLGNEVIPSRHLSSAGSTPRIDRRLAPPAAGDAMFERFYGMAVPRPLGDVRDCSVIGGQADVPHG
jgi:hypothetical protein